jgi:two-component system, NtrC family, response regulator AtoC
MSRFVPALRLSSNRARWSKPSMAAGAVLLVVIPAALVSRRLASVVSDYQFDLWPMMRVVARSVGDWVGQAAALVGVAVAHDLQRCESAAMRAVRELVARVARTDAPVVLLGETGVGKEIVARALHEASPRRDGPFVKVNCAAIPSELMESEFFGHEKGAFTHAHARSRGHFERAHEGTLFLDEIGDLPLGLQAKLLDVLQDGSLYRVGGTERLQVDVRVIAATNRDLHAAVATGQFRDDLYYRLNVVEARVPPLRDRRDDIPALVACFVERCENEHGCRPVVSRDLLALFQRYDWPGNVRELETMIRRIAVLGSDDVVRQELHARLAGAEPAPVPRDASGVLTAGALVDLKAIAREAARSAEREAILTVLGRVRWNRTKAAQLLGISYRGLRNKLSELGLSREDDPAA